MITRRKHRHCYTLHLMSPFETVESNRMRTCSNPNQRTIRHAASVKSPRQSFRFHLRWLWLWFPILVDWFSFWNVAAGGGGGGYHHYYCYCEASTSVITTRSTPPMAFASSKAVTFVPKGIVSHGHLSDPLTTTHLSHKPAHPPLYKDALLQRILSGRTSTNPRWRRRTKRAAATLGVLSYSSYSSSGSLSNVSTLSKYHHAMDRRTRNGISSNTISTNTNTIRTGMVPRGNILAFQKRPRNWNVVPKTSTSNIRISRPVPPMTSLVFQSTRNHHVLSEHTPSYDHSSVFSNRTTTTTTTTTIATSLVDTTHTQNSTKIIRFLRKPKLTPSQHQAAKLDWAAKYTSLDVLRASFGTNRNKIWGDFDTKTTRKLYHTLLPRALLGLYEAGLWCPTDLAPLAFEARLAAKKYARERCVLPGRVWAMMYDGYRSWRSWGTWSVEGMSWEQVWNKYETQILEEYMEEDDDIHDGHLKIDWEELQDEITARICVRILERSCITNEQVDKMFLKEDSNDDAKAKHSNTMSRSQKRRRKAERDLLRIKDRLERDVQELQLMELEKQKEQHISNKIPFLMDILNGFLPHDDGDTYGSGGGSTSSTTQTHSSSMNSTSSSDTTKATMK